MDLVRVLVVDDEKLVRHALRLFLASSSETVVVGDAADGAEGLELARAIRPDVVLMDIQMPVMDGIEATARITSELPRTRVLALTTFSTDRHVVAVLRAGASGLLVKDTHPDEIIAAVAEVHAGGSVLSPEVARDLVAEVRDPRAPDGRWILSQAEMLTARELSIVTLLARGQSNAEIARALHLSEATVKSNLGRIMSKWGVRDRVQVLIRAVRAHLVTL